MQAIIVAAGEGRRLSPLTKDRPKALLEVQGQSLISRSVGLLMDAGISDLALVVGYRKEMLMDHLADYPVTFHFNPFYRITNNMASLWFARSFVREDFLYLHSDLIYDPRLLHQLVDSGQPDTLLVERKACASEEMKVTVKDARLVASSKEIPLTEAFGEWTGLARFSPSFGGILFDRIGALIEDGHLMAYDTFAFTELAKEGHAIGITAFTDLPWVEIDTPDDLQLARRLFESG
ncbi:MAG: NTP transferase domain-containing protein [Candidatus Neomarinimicrobiota bacterium]